MIHGQKSVNWRTSVLVILALFALLGIGLSLICGAVNITIPDVLYSLFGGQSTYHDIIWNIRLPRTIVAALVGISLLLSGALLLLTPITFVGAIGAALLIYLMAWRGGVSPLRVILAGVAVSALLNAGISALLTLYSDRVGGALIFMVGGLSARSWPHVYILLPYTLIGTLLAVIGSQRLNIMALGEEQAKGLGLRVESHRLYFTAIATLLAASTVSVVGLLGFVGMIVPHSARLLIGSDYRWLLPACVLLSVGVLTISDTVARIIFAPMELPVGIVMGVLGAPFFLYLVRRRVL
ncbi:corrinoid ABC transporter permease [Paenibacillus marchantiophytorum]|uniref:Corrinoid ABC transporter permease n=1 Tax=Paenibacillus marchantiophytorum TaxID=1619310 RepID=A0ABQ1FJP4_9BACL|nr:iron ABC transporter permease [Paenibacillus marchantiophytorum]GGA14496.1 corrinoid ABC transporter permease [Paenibacillus marchantiophytorum]